MNRGIPFVVLCGAAALAASGCLSTHAQSIAPADVPAVAVARVTRGDVSQSLTVAAEFHPFQEIDLHAKVAGYVKRINVDVGDRVHQGQLLAVLEVPELQDDLAENDAAAKRAVEEVKRAQADLERARSMHQVSHLAATRLAAVMKAQPRLVAQQDIDDATGRDRASEAQVSTAEAALAAAREQLDVAKANQARTQALVAYSRITAPFAGVVTYRYADTGAMIQAGTSSQTQTMPVVKLSENSLLRLVIPVPESAVPRVHLGQPVDVRVESLGRTFPGKVARFADRLDTDTRTMRVEVDVPNPGLALVPGMYADATLVLDQANGVLVAPVQAIDRSGDKASVMVVTADHKVQPRDVVLGLESADRVEITSGLQADDLVVVGNRAQLKAGTVVTTKLAAMAAGTD